MGIVQQFLSPFYNRRDDEFGDGVRFLELLHDEIRDRAGDVPLMTKVPDESPAPPVVRRRLSTADAVGIADRLDRIGYDALVPVRTSVVWDMSIVRGEFPARAWDDLDLESEYAAAFGGRGKARLVRLLNRLQAVRYDFESAWNADLCRRVRERVDDGTAVLCEGGIRERGEMDELLGTGRPQAADAVGMARPFYAEPRLPARLLDGTAETRTACESCNNCTIPQATGRPGVCRTPSVLERRGELERAGAYDRDGRAPTAENRGKERANGRQFNNR
jgi:2,4-dienoyl-CoA reductase-like NADH-dependent reductase (Old Yellow Enzyme family)